MFCFLSLVFGVLCPFGDQWPIVDLVSRREASPSYLSEMRLGGQLRMLQPAGQSVVNAAIQ